LLSTTPPTTPMNAAIVIRVDDRGRSVRDVRIAANTKPDSLAGLQIMDGTVAGLDSDWS
jgi:hypothetical protein